VVRVRGGMGYGRVGMIHSCMWFRERVRVCRWNTRNVTWTLELYIENGIVTGKGGVTTCDT